MEQKKLVEEKELVYVGTSRATSSEMSFATAIQNENSHSSHLLNVDKSQNEINLDENNIQNPKKQTIFSKKPKNKKNNNTLLNMDNLLSDKKNTDTKTQKSDNKNDFVVQNQPRTINISEDIICPKCGSIMLGGLCINCERKKDTNND